MKNFSFPQNIEIINKIFTFIYRIPAIFLREWSLLHRFLTDVAKDIQQTKFNIILR